MIYYDITDLLDHLRRAPCVFGIPRVTLATVSSLRDRFASEDVRLIAFHPRRKMALCLDLSDFPAGVESGPELSAHFGWRYRGPRPIDSYLPARKSAGAARLFAKWRLLLANALTGGRTFRRKGIAGSAFKPPAHPPEWRIPGFVAGDIVLLSGGMGQSRRFLGELAAARRDKGVRLAHFVHDVLPLTHPQFFQQGHPAAFADWLTRIARTSDLIVATTERNRRDCEAELRRRGCEPPPVLVVPLAHEFLEAAGNPATFTPLYEKVSSPALVAARLPFALCVGTREIRKNNLGLAQAWAALERKHGAALPRLIFAGRNGWLNDEFERFLRRTDNVGDKIVLLDSPTDDELAYLYRSCLFTVFPSFCEGWGLPIGESLWFDRPVVTSACGSIPEVAGAFADYADPFDASALEEAIGRLLDTDYRQERIAALAGMSKRSWSDFAEDLFGKMHEAGLQRQAP